MKLGLIIIVTAFLIALFAPFLAPTGLNVFDLSSRLQGPTVGHPFGFDDEGRDLLTLVIWGTRISMIVSVATVLVAGTVGTLIGLTAGYFRQCDRIFIFITDVVLSFPSILLIIALAAFQRETGLMTVILILSAVGWVSYARIVRGQVLTLREREYVQASVGLGASTGRIWRKHLLPNLMAPLLVNATFGMAGVILAESTLSFLGIGLPADIPSWGRLLDQGVQYLLIAPHLSIFPGVAIALLILGFNFLGDGLRDHLDVKGGVK